MTGPRVDFNLNEDFPPKPSDEKVDTKIRRRDMTYFGYVSFMIIFATVIVLICILLEK